VDTVHECDRWTDGQTDRQTDRITMTKTVQRIASHGKNTAIKLEVETNYIHTKSQSPNLYKWQQTSNINCRN